MRTPATYSRFVRVPRMAGLCLTLVLLLTAGSGPARAADARPATYIFRTVNGLDIQADVYKPAAKEGEAESARRPVLVWIHGGALILGSRRGVPRQLTESMGKAGVVVVSIDYRLAPEVPLPEIISDVEAAFTWVRKDGPRLFRADPTRIAVSGGSAGGYLTLISGYRVEPRPVALVPFWGYGDLLGDWLTQPSPHPRHRRIQLDRDEAWKLVDGDPVSASDQRKKNAAGFYYWCRRTGSWPEAVSGWDPATEAEKYTPYMPVKNVTADWPPTLMIHGTADTDVPFEQSQLMAEQFAKHKVPHRLIAIPNGEHGLGGGDPQLIKQSYQAAIDFLLQHLQAQ